MLARSLRWLRRAEDALLGVLLLALVVLSSAQILRRTLFQDGWFGAESAGRSLVLWIALLGALAATREGRHVRIDVAEHWLPEALRGPAARCAQAVAAMVCAVLAWFGAQLVLLEREFPEIAFAGIPGWWISAVIPFGFAMMSLRFALHSVFGAPVAEADP